MERWGVTTRIGAAKKDDKERDPNKPITAKEQAVIDARFEKLVQVAQTVGGDYDMEVRLGEPGGGSFFNPDDKSITLDPLHVLKSPETAEFVTGHEGMHRAITRNAADFGYPQSEIMQMYRQLGFGWMHNAIEDASGNTWLGERFVGFKPLVKTFYDGQFEKQNAVLSTPEVVKAAGQLGYWPNFAHFGSEMLRRWHTGAYSKKLDPAVDVALNKTQAAVDQCVAAYPDPISRDEDYIRARAKVRFEVANDEVWPEMKKMVEDDMNIEAAMKKMQELLKKAKERDEKRRQLSRTLRPSKRAQLKKEIEELDKDLVDFDALEERMREALKAMADATDKARKGGGSPHDLTDLEREALRRAFESLSEEEKRKLAMEARKRLEQFEDALNKAMRSKLDPNAAPTHEEIAILDEEEAKEAERIAKEAARQQELQGELDRDREKNMTEFERLMREARPFSNHLYNRLMRDLHPEEFEAEETGLPMGEWIEMSRVMQAQADFRQKLQLWARAVEGDKRDYALQFAVDTSGSTEDILHAQQVGLVGASDALNRLEGRNSERVKIRHSISRFTTTARLMGDPYKVQYEVPKGFGQRLTPQIGNTIASWEAGGGTPTDVAVKNELDRAFKERATTGTFIFIISDGDPDVPAQPRLRKLLASTKAQREAQKVRVGLIWLGAEEGADELQKVCKQKVDAYGFDFGLAMSDLAGKDGGGHFGEQLSGLIREIVAATNK